MCDCYRYMFFYLGYYMWRVVVVCECGTVVLTGHISGTSVSPPPGFRWQFQAVRAVCGWADRFHAREIERSQFPGKTAAVS